MSISKKSPGRPKVDLEDRHFQVGVSMSPKMYRALDAAVIANSFSGKVEAALIEWFAMKNLLIQYRSEDQIREGTPVILNEFAERIYACSQFQVGWSFKGGRYAQVILDCLNTLDKGWGNRQQKWVHTIAVPAIRRLGLVVQVADVVEHDLFDVWVCDSMLGAAGQNCGKCSVVYEMADYLQKVKDRRSI